MDPLNRKIKSNQPNFHNICGTLATRLFVHMFNQANNNTINTLCYWLLARVIQIIRTKASNPERVCMSWRHYYGTSYFVGYTMMLHTGNVAVLQYIVYCICSDTIIIHRSPVAVTFKQCINRKQNQSMSYHIICMTINLLKFVCNEMWMVEEYTMNILFLEARSFMMCIFSRD